MKLFLRGQFVAQRSGKKFSLMALDQSQEHSIKFLKEDSGTKGLYGQPDEKDIIELSKPEVMRIIDEFENAISPSNKVVAAEHPQSSDAEQNKFYVISRLCPSSSKREQLSILSKKQAHSLSLWSLVKSWIL